MDASSRYLAPVLPAAAARFRSDMNDRRKNHLYVAREVPSTEVELKLLPPEEAGRVPPRLAVGWYRVQQVEVRLARIVWASVRSDSKLAIVVNEY